MLRWFLATLVVAGGGVLAASQAGVDPYEWISDISTPYFREKFAQSTPTARPQDRFLVALRTARHDLEAGKISLRESCRQIEKAANDYFPSYLLMVNLTTEGSDLEEKIARQLVDHLREQAAAAAPLSRLERELNDIVTH